MKLGPEIRDVNQEFTLTPLGETHRRPGRSERWGGAVLGALLLCSACGYGAVYGGSSGRRYAVASGGYTTSSFEAVQEATSGVRSELQAAQGLGHGLDRKSVV